MDVTLELVAGDITTVPVDAIVNAANSSNGRRRRCRRRHPPRRRPALLARAGCWRLPTAGDAKATDGRGACPPATSSTPSARCGTAAPRASRSAGLGAPPLGRGRRRARLRVGRVPGHLDRHLRVSRRAGGAGDVEHSDGGGCRRGIGACAAAVFVLYSDGDHGHVSAGGGRPRARLAALRTRAAWSQTASATPGQCGRVPRSAAPRRRFAWGSRPAARPAFLTQTVRATSFDAHGTLGVARSSPKTSSAGTKCPKPSAAASRRAWPSAKARPASAPRRRRVRRHAAGVQGQGYGTVRRRVGGDLELDGDPGDSSSVSHSRILISPAGAVLRGRRPQPAA